ncbi:hypothetical protein SASPL_127280 [Salvia splendens]|uniref:CCHC-type domain-containing protein n=1 Tax=Salvia splendens TaxID=180675 RepID=A0A8X8ZSF3_SALSN|nr:hypothetical protein SASPL_127280 [Salvia splendens]
MARRRFAARKRVRRGASPEEYVRAYQTYQRCHGDSLWEFLAHFQRLWWDAAFHGSVTGYDGIVRLMSLLPNEWREWATVEAEETLRHQWRQDVPVSGSLKQGHLAQQQGVGLRLCPRHHQHNHLLPRAPLLSQRPSAEHRRLPGRGRPLTEQAIGWWISNYPWIIQGEYLKVQLLPQMQQTTGGICKSGTDACFNCGKTGHFAKHCPNKTPVTGAKPHPSAQRPQLCAMNVQPRANPQQPPRNQPQRPRLPTLAQSYAMRQK